METAKALVDADNAKYRRSKHIKEQQHLAEQQRIARKRRIEEQKNIARQEHTAEKKRISDGKQDKLRKQSPEELRAKAMANLFGNNYLKEKGTKEERPRKKSKLGPLCGMCGGIK